MVRRRDIPPLNAMVLSGIVLIALLLGGCAQGGGGDAVEFTAAVNGVDVSTSEPSDPIELSGAEPAELDLTVENVAGEPVTVRYIRFEGQVLDMIFLTYDTAVRIDLEPGERRDVPTVVLDFFDLGGQASGYLRGHVQLYDEERGLLGTEQMFLDAKGDALSTLGLFNLLLLFATAAGLGWNLYRLAQRRLPPNRFVRAVRFLAVGVGAGLTLSVAFSTLRIWPLGTVAWVLFAVIGGIAGYAAGFLLPGADELVDILDEQDVLDAVLDSEAPETVTGPDGRTTIRLQD